MIEGLNEVITSYAELSAACVERDGFAFTSIDKPSNVYDAIILRNPATADRLSPMLGVSPRSTADHIRCVNENQLRKAFVFAESLDFLLECPSLEFLHVVPVHRGEEKFDFSPLYRMPALKGVTLVTQDHFGRNTNRCLPIDYRRMPSLMEAAIVGKGHIGYEQVPTMRKLGLSFQPQKDLTDICAGGSLVELDMDQCRLESLRGIGAAQQLRTLALEYNRNLSDISDLRSVAPTLEALQIVTCSKIQDFSCLDSLTNLKHLVLEGKNVLPSLSFLKNMPHLKTLVMHMDVADGDIRPCASLPYACIRNKRHFNMKDQDLPKNR